MEDVMEYGSYGEYKRELDQEMGRAAESFVRIGYLLKVARDTDILRESGYTTLAQFAWAEYRLSPDKVSRFTKINDRFSVDGYSPILAERYKGMGQTKLAEMLQLPDAVNAELSPGYTREDIKTIREEIDEEQKITDIEVLLEGREENAEEETLAAALMKQLLHDGPELYRELYPLLGSGKEKDPQAARWALAPSGEAMYSVRLRGIGKFLLSLKTEEPEAAVINIRTQEKERCSWEEILDACSRRMSPGMTPEDSWEKAYGEPLERKEEEPEERPEQKEEPKKKVRNPAKENAEKKKEEKVRAEIKKYWKGAGGDEGTAKNTGGDLGQNKHGDGYAGGNLGGTGERPGDSAADDPDAGGGRGQDDKGRENGDIREQERHPEGGGHTGQGAHEGGTPDPEETGDPAGLPGGLQLPAGRPAVPDGTERPDTVSEADAGQGTDEAQVGSVSAGIPDAGAGIGTPAGAGRSNVSGIGAEGGAGHPDAREAAAGEIAPAQQIQEGYADKLPEYVAVRQTRKEYLDGLTEYGAALYISQQYRDRELGRLNMESVEELDRWFSASVDALGNRL